MLSEEAVKGVGLWLNSRHFIPGATYLHILPSDKVLQGGGEKSLFQGKKSLKEASDIKIFNISSMILKLPLKDFKSYL